MSQHIKTRFHCNRERDRLSKQRIYNGNLRIQGFPSDPTFYLPLLIRNNSRFAQLTSGSGCGRNGNHRQCAFPRFSALIKTIANILHHPDTGGNRLCSIHCTAAAKADDALHTFRFAQADPSSDFRKSWIGTDFVKYDYFFYFFKCFCLLLQPSHIAQTNQSSSRCYNHNSTL